LLPASSASVCGNVTWTSPWRHETAAWAPPAAPVPVGSGNYKRRDPEREREREREREVATTITTITTTTFSAITTTLTTMTTATITTISSTVIMIIQGSKCTMTARGCSHPALPGAAHRAKRLRRIDVEHDRPFGLAVNDEQQSQHRMPPTNIECDVGISLAQVRRLARALEQQRLHFLEEGEGLHQLLRTGFGTRGGTVGTPQRISQRPAGRLSRLRCRLGLRLGFGLGFGLLHIRQRLWLRQLRQLLRQLMLLAELGATFCKRSLDASERSKACTVVQPCQEALLFRRRFVAHASALAALARQLASCAQLAQR
jgi:hypothetical protein